MGNVNRKETKAEMAHLNKVVGDAFPGCKSVIGSHSDYGGHRAPRVYTISFRVQDAKGKYISNVIWVFPDEILNQTPDSIKHLVDISNGR